MSIVNWSEGEQFTLRLYKRLIARPDTVWANTYEFRATGSSPGSAAEVSDAISIMAMWERLFHLNTVEYDRGVFSTLVPDGEPYQPSSFVSKDLSGVSGTRSASGQQPLGLEVCLLVRKSVSFGRAGRWLYRGCLLEADVSAPSGTFVLEAAAQTAIQGNINTDVGDSDDILEEMRVNVGLEMSQIGGTGAGTVRNVDAITAAGVVVKKLNNRYFNRPGLTP